MKYIFSLITVLLMCSGCGLKLSLPNFLPEDSNNTIKHSAEYCSGLESQLYSWLQNNSQCVSDSDCRTDYGGCLSLAYNSSTNLAELNQRVSQWNNACAAQRGLCGIPPGIPVCENGKCGKSFNYSRLVGN